MTHHATICLGSNCNDRRANIDAAIERIAAHCRVETVSEIHESPDVSGRGAPYLNCVVTVQSALDQQGLAALLSQCEAMGGRTPQSRATGIMPIDIDLVIIDGRIVSQHDYESPYFKLCTSSATF